MLDDLNALIRERVRWSPAAWFEAYAKIRRKGGELVSPRANVYQQRIDEVVRIAHEMGRPCRIIGLKPRQKGSSTFSVACFHSRLHAKPASGLIAGGAHFQAKNLFKILRTYAETDELDPGKCKVLDMEARYANGSTAERITLRNQQAGRSGTYQAMIITEVAYLAAEGVANADDVLDGLLKCVPFEPDTLIIEESTANGAAGRFFDSFQQAITLEEFKAGKNGRVKVFAAWYEFDDSRMDPAGEGIEDESDLTAGERELAEKWNLDLEQVAWMRWALREECGGDWDRFLQDYPFDAESAFLKSGRGRFSIDGLRYQDEVAKRCPREFGYFEYNERADRVTWQRTTEQEARAVRWEQPRPGFRYLVSIDPMTGASQTGGDDPDSHAVFVIRAGYYERGRWVEPAVVARNILVKDGTRFGCWWDIDVLEEEVWRMARYYQALVVPEMNMDRGMVELLKLRGDVDIYEREMFNRREQVKTTALGWVTDRNTRNMVIEKLAEAVREAGRGIEGQGFEVRCPWAISQMRNFVVKANGRAEAATGHHDDDVLALAIGVQTLGNALPWREVEAAGWVPPDLRGGEDERRGGAGQWS
jgi:hypothetical protein